MKEYEKSLVTEDMVSIDMSNSTASYEMNLTGEIGGTYMGLFKFKTILTPLQEIEADRDYRSLLGSNAELATTHIDMMCYTLAQLKHRIIEAPPFWNGENTRFPGSQIKDREILQAALEAAIIAETKYKNLIKKKNEEALNKLRKNIEQAENKEENVDE